jgi:hypothetical protein
VSSEARFFQGGRGLVGKAGGLVAVGVAASVIAGCQTGGRDTAKLDSSSYPTSPALNRLVGHWNVEGSMLSAAGERIAFGGTASGTVEKDYFLRLDLQIRDPRNRQEVGGTSVIGQDGGRLLTMANAFSTSPELRVYRGELDPDGSAITLTQIGRSSADARRLVLRFVSNDQWTAEAWNSGSAETTSPPVEVLAFRRAP